MLELAVRVLSKLAGLPRPAGTQGRERLAAVWEPQRPAGTRSSAVSAAWEPPQLAQRNYFPVRSCEPQARQKRSPGRARLPHWWQYACPSSSTVPSVRADGLRRRPFGFTSGCSRPDCQYQIAPPTINKSPKPPITQGKTDIIVNRFTGVAPIGPLGSIGMV